MNVLNVDENGLGLWKADDYVKEDVRLNYTEVTAAMFQLILGERMFPPVSTRNGKTLPRRLLRLSTRFGILGLESGRWRI